MTATTTPHLVVVQDHEGDGRCGHCGREGLRWIAHLSDGTAVGTECAKTVLGFKPAPKTYEWASQFHPIAHYTDADQHYVLWQHNTGSATRETRNGVLTAVGGARRAWHERGWPTTTQETR